jgi:GT2 family glycosyltransferase
MPNTKSPEISVIICTYNTKDLTCKCLDRLKKSIDFLGKPVETIVIENGIDGTGEVVKKKYSWVKLLEPTQNTGFAKGNNLGIKASSKNTKYYLFLNTDALVDAETLSKAVEFMENHNTCQVLGCKLKFGDGRMQPSAGYLPNPFNTALWMFGLDKFSVSPVHPKNKEFFDKDRRVGWVMGAFLFMRREVVGKTKGFDENFFMYMEEVDWCKRISDEKLEIWYSPSFEITHLDKASSGFDVRKPLTREIQGLRYYLKRYYPNYDFIMKPIIWLGVAERLLVFSLTGDKNRADIYRDILKEV